MTGHYLGGLSFRFAELGIVSSPIWWHSSKVSDLVSQNCRIRRYKTRVRIERETEMKHSFVIGLSLAVSACSGWRWTPNVGQPGPLLKV